MRNCFAILVLCAAGCVTESSPSGTVVPVVKTDDELKAEKEVGLAYEDWKDATLSGDVRRHLSHMTPAFISHWMWMRTRDDRDERIKKWMALMPPRVETDFTMWRKFNDQNKPDRADMLPPAVLNSEWLVMCYGDYYKAGLETERHHLSTGHVVSIAVDAYGATVVTSIGRQSEQWVMSRGGDGRWRLDGYLPPRQ